MIALAAPEPDCALTLRQTVHAARSNRLALTVSESGIPRSVI